MLPKEHFEAQAIADQADAAFANGEIENADKLYAQAAELQSAALQQIPKNKTRTIGILAYSAASLWYKASRFEEAEKLTRETLQWNVLPKTERAQLLTILNEMPVIAARSPTHDETTDSGKQAGGSAGFRTLANDHALTSEERAYAAEARFRQAYEENFAFLASIAANKFRVPSTEAETLAHEVFLRYLRKSDTITDLRAWLIGAICHASRHYWRANRRIVDADPDVDMEFVDPAAGQIVDVLSNQIAARAVLEKLTPRYQEILRLRYFAGMTVPEIASYLGVKPKYAQKLVSKCLKRAEKVFTEHTDMANRKGKGAKREQAGNLISDNTVIEK